MSLTSRGSNCHDDPFRWQRKSSLFLATSYLASLSGSHAAACTPPASMSAGLRPSLIVAHCRRRTSSSSLGHLVAMMRRSASFYRFLATGQPVASHRLCFHVEVFLQLPLNGFVLSLLARPMSLRAIGIARHSFGSFIWEPYCFAQKMPCRQSRCSALSGDFSPPALIGFGRVLRCTRTFRLHRPYRSRHPPGLQPWALWPLWADSIFCFRPCILRRLSSLTKRRPLQLLKLSGGAQFTRQASVGDQKCALGW